LKFSGKNGFHRLGRGGEQLIDGHKIKAKEKDENKKAQGTGLFACALRLLSDFY
jgi:hypothetical protein